MNVWLSLLLSAAAFGSFSWALQGHFKHNGRPPAPMIVLSIISLLSYGSYIGSLYRLPPVGVGLVGQWALFTVSFCLFWWTIAATRTVRPSLAHSGDVPTLLYESGPYRYVRHPFYLAYIIFWSGAALAGGGWQWLWAILLSAWYVSIATGEEEQLRQSPLALRYANYQNRVGMILPWRRNRIL